MNTYPYKNKSIYHFQPFFLFYNFFEHILKHIFMLLYQAYLEDRGCKTKVVLGSTNNVILVCCPGHVSRPGSKTHTGRNNCPSLQDLLDPTRIFQTPNYFVIIFQFYDFCIIGYTIGF